MSFWLISNGQHIHILLKKIKRRKWTIWNHFKLFMCLWCLIYCSNNKKIPFTYYSGDDFKIPQENNFPNLITEIHRNKHKNTSWLPNLHLQSWFFLTFRCTSSFLLVIVTFQALNSLYVLPLPPSSLPHYAPNFKEWNYHPLNETSWMPRLLPLLHSTYGI